MPSAPPGRPVLAFRIGVIGHRWDRLQPAGPAAGVAGLAAAGTLEAGLVNAVQPVLASLASYLGAIAEEPRNGYQVGAAARLSVVSGLAEGADRIVARSGLRQGYQLTAVLPYAREEYRKDFDGSWTAPSWSRPGADTEFDELLGLATAVIETDGAPGRYDAYEPLGHAVLSQSDILIVIWNGQGGRGPGGTANLLAEARREEIPIVRIDPSRPERVWLEEGSQPDEGVSLGLQGLWARIDRLIKAPDQSGLSGQADAEAREAFWAERPVRGYLGKAFQLFVEHFEQLQSRAAAAFKPTMPLWFRVIRFWGRPQLPADYTAAARSAWYARFGGQLAPSELVSRVVERLAPLHGRLDLLGQYYADRYRSAYTVIFSLAWVAAVAAVAGLIAHGAHSPLALVFAWLELGVILGILGLTFWGKRRRFHEKWIDYRLLAEQVRHLAFLWPIGATSSAARLPVELAPGDPRACWTGWLYRALVRDLGFGFGQYSAAHAEACRRFLRSEEIPAQRAYHARLAARYRRVSHAVHVRTDWLFGAAAVVALLHVVGAPHWLAGGLGGGAEALASRELAIAAVLTVLSVFFPARAAALHGWVGQSDLSAAALRSADIAIRLGEVERAMDAAVATDSRSLRIAALRASRIMESELGNWRTASVSRPLQRV